MSLYPEGYADPPYDGTVEGWREVVLPARMEAIRVTFDAMLADLGFPDMHWEWAAQDACCDLHGRNCEPPSELCCRYCTTTPAVPLPTYILFYVFRAVRRLRHRIARLVPCFRGAAGPGRCRPSIACTCQRSGYPT